jgi:hypothetical protein
MTVTDRAILLDGEIVGRLWHEEAGWRVEWAGIVQQTTFDPTKPSEIAEVWAVHEVAELLAMQGD